ncbi:MAG: FAD-dependent oxidoreductase [Ilumatobacteraceae bacterium]
MTDVVVAGGGFTGLAAALFMARRGHLVTVVERDGPPTGSSPDDDAQHWKRPGAPQSHQSHLLLGRARRVLAEEAPDVIDEFIARGIRQAPVVIGAGTLDDEFFIMSRRLVAEATLRRIVEREPGVRILSGDAVVGLEVNTSGDIPIVTGVRLASGAVLAAPLVVDAGGRRSALPSWLADVGARPPIDQTQECGFSYTTRYFRVRPGCTAPPTRVPAAFALDYATVLAFGADNGTFSITATLSTHDPFRSRLRDPDCHTKFLNAVPTTAPWMAVGEPISDISTMSRIENRRRNLVDDNGPIVGGVVALGDAALHTNPTLGRGISLGFWHAQHLAEVVSTAADSPTRFVQDFHNWTAENLAIWFDTQVAVDAAGLARLEAGLRGERLPPSTDPMSRFQIAAFTCAEHDAVVGKAVASMVHLLKKPAEALGDPVVADRIQQYLLTNPDLDRKPDVPSRQEFEKLVSI